MAPTCEWWVIAVVGCVQLLLLLYVVVYADMEWEACYSPGDDSIDRYLAIIYNTFGLPMWFLALWQTGDYENYENQPMPSVLGCLAQAVVMAFYCFVSTTICPCSTPAFAVWVSLGVIEAIYLLFAFARVISHLCR